MAKRKYVGSTATIPPSKRTKLDASACDIRAATSLTPPTTSQTSFNRPEKRKRTDLLEDLNRSKRPRTSNSSSNSSSNLTTSSPESSPVAWPNIEEAEISSEEEMDEMARQFRAVYKRVSEMGPKRLYDYRQRILYQDPLSSPAPPHRDPLPSPTPSDRDTIESDTDVFPTTETQQARNSALKSQKIPSSRLQVTPPPRTRSRGHSRSRLHIKEDDAARFRQQPTPKRQPHRKRKERKEEKEKNSGNDDLQDWKSSPDVQGFLGSRRSSRRNAECELWYLGDDGKAYMR